ncbi:MAG: hypothetical protein HY548_01355, partial [Elusimicrobia bacterium]|nr:hypothetical protein [Elusimicrobiota bacterium]
MKKKNMGHYFRRVLWISGRDVYQSIRRESGVSFEARAGAWTFLGLFLSALLQGKSGAFFSVDPVGAILVEGPFRSWQGWGAQGIVALGSGALGAILGIVVQNAWAFWSDLFPVLGRARRSWRIGVTVAFVLFMHGAFLLTDMTANPALYQEAFYQQGGILRGIQVFATDQCPIFLLMFYKTVVFLLIGFACLQVLKKVLLWYSHLSRPTRLAGVVLGFALLAAAV